MLGPRFTCLLLAAPGALLAQGKKQSVSDAQSDAQSVDEPDMKFVNSTMAFLQMSTRAWKGMNDVGRSWKGMAPPFLDQQGGSPTTPQLLDHAPANAKDATQGSSTTLEREEDSVDQDPTSSDTDATGGGGDEVAGVE